MWREKKPWSPGREAETLERLSLEQTREAPAFRVGGPEVRRNEVMRRSLASGILLGVVVAVLGSGCALSDLKDANQRLVEARDRLLSENNRLDNELKSARQEIGLLQSELNSVSRVPLSSPPS